MRYFRFRNWERYQHYRDRNPIWVKLYCSILDDGDDWQRLTDAECGVLAKLLALASRMGNAIPCNSEIVAAEINADSPINLEKYAEIGVIEIMASRQECVAAERVRVESLKSASNPASNRASNRASKNARLREERGEFLESERGDKEKTPPTPRKRGRVVAAELKEDVAKIVDHLNAVTGKRHGAEKATGEIERCLNAGATVAECCEVIDHCWAQWKDNPKMVKFVNKVTPFRAIHFDAYLDEARAGRPKPKPAPKPVEDDDPDLSPAEREAARQALERLGVGGLCNWT